MHIAIVHFSGPPAIGGIERLIAAQARTLSRIGQHVRVIVGGGDDCPAAETIMIAQLNPAHDGVVAARSALSSAFPRRDHPLVRSLGQALERALAGCDACWVHNLFTVYLNPFATVALWQLVERRSDIRWLAWCEDLTAASSFQRDLSPSDMELARRPLSGVRYVTISRRRRDELISFLGPVASGISVVPPPLDIGEWIGLDGETRRILQAVRYFDSDAVILVPSKILSHKGIERAVRVAASLRGLAHQPLVLITGAASPHEPRMSSSMVDQLDSTVRDQGLGETLYVLSRALGGTPSHHTMRDLMLLSDVVFLPSHEEGFGLPLREAAVLRAPVLCSDIPVFREIAGGWARFFGLDDRDIDVAEAIVEMARSPMNVARREALLSQNRFEMQLKELLRDPLIPGPSPSMGEER
jgi:glycosyltransferase involved in cell wall biosynthesis